MSEIHWKPFVVVTHDGYPMWGTRLVVSTLAGIVIGVTCVFIILAVEL